MSITSSNNLAVNNSLTVTGNTILGADSAYTLICNSKPTFNTDVTINGNITQSSSNTFSTGSGTVNLNGDVVISSTKKLTTGTGLTTINGITQANNIIKILSGSSLYITDAALTNYLRMHHSGAASYFDYTGGLSFRNSGSVTSLQLNNTNNQGTFNYNLNTNGIINSTNGITNNSTLSQVGSATFSGGITNNTVGITNNSTLTQVGSASFNALSATSITNNGILSTGSLELYNATFPYIDMKSVNSDFDVRLGCSSGSSGTSGQGILTINAANTIIASPLTANSGTFSGITNNTNSLTNNAVLNQNNNSNFSTYINAPGISSSSSSFYAGSYNNFDATVITSPKIINGIASGNSDGSSYTNFNLAINSWQGVGFVDTALKTCNLVINNRTGDLSSKGTISCANLTTTGTITFSDVNAVNIIASNSITTLSIYDNGPIYMVNASPIYLKSNTDATHYIKYSSTYNAPQIGFYNKFTVLCTDTNGNEVIISCTKDNVNLNKNTSISGTLSTTQELNCGTKITTPITFSPFLNNSKYVTVRGYSYKSSGVVNHYHKHSDDQTTLISSQFSIALPTDCISMCSQYSYYTTGTNSFQGVTNTIIANHFNNF